MKKSDLRRSVRAALRNEQKQGELRRWLAWRLPTLPKSIRVPGATPKAELEAFAHIYINQVPSYFHTVSQLTRALGVNAIATPVLRLVADAFEESALPQTPGGLVDLLHLAYFGHRLLEEVTDYCVAASGGPQLPYAMTLANLICHDLIGEPFANELDADVQAIAEHWLAGRPLPRNPRASVRAQGIHWPPPPANLSLNGTLSDPLR